MLSHIGLFLLCIGGVWFTAGAIVDLVDSIAKKLNKNGFFVAFFVLAFVTSLGEFSVALNSLANGTPAISVGNTIGASFALLILVVPLLAVIGNGIKMDKFFDRWRLALVLAIVAVPSLLVLFGTINWISGVVALGAYVMLLFMLKIKKEKKVNSAVKVPLSQFLYSAHFWIDIAKILVLSGIIFVAGNVLVKEASFFAHHFNAPEYLIGILLLSFGTNVPEIAVAVRSVLKKRAEVALGNYLGSATFNTLTFAIVALFSAPFVVGQSVFLVSFLFVVLGFVLLYFFIRSKDILSRSEGYILLGIYFAFIVIQILLLIRFANQ